MWKQYRKTLIPTQIAITAVVIAVYFMSGRQWYPAMMMYLVMQFFSFAGAKWAVRLQSGILRNEQNGRLLRPRG